MNIKSLLFRLKWEGRNISTTIHTDIRLIAHDVIFQLQAELKIAHENIQLLMRNGGKAILGLESKEEEIERLRKALEDKIVKCCETCDSFFSHAKMKTYPIPIGSSNGFCPFDSSEHLFKDSCKNWNIEAFESEVKK